jgi:hypothetical protein
MIVQQNLIRWEIISMSEDYRIFLQATMRAARDRGVTPEGVFDLIAQLPTLAEVRRMLESYQVRAISDEQAGI